MKQINFPSGYILAHVYNLVLLTSAISRNSSCTDYNTTSNNVQQLQHQKQQQQQQQQQKRYNIILSCYLIFKHPGVGSHTEHHKTGWSPIWIKTPRALQIVECSINAPLKTYLYIKLHVRIQLNAPYTSFNAYNSCSDCQKKVMYEKTVVKLAEKSIHRYCSTSEHLD